jgi:hypothetical protein
MLEALIEDIKYMLLPLRHDDVRWKIHGSMENLHQSIIGATLPPRQKAIGDNFDRLAHP